ncbi:aminodeoxychorismate synthase, component I [Streptomyces inusitatus]|uniref:aminodeoxychorismate synthase n=1 Tax=Streptomyces inusitatus TaxID=68221 RepID=A0A918PM95_9ACTN|nr:aminodeoxychorismate synthase component I [Streptomyces inusitatus]GGZ14560.1 aminodeoxychorismate synthase, component I [Streptomyces inusitatus]
MLTLLIDNYDSFTYNLGDLMHRVYGVAPHVVTHDTPWREIDLDAYDAVVVSPGPGRPQREADLGISAHALRQDRVPVLGICLGHQGIAHFAGARIGHAPEATHGRTSEVFHREGDGLFDGIPSPFTVVRYHSLAVTELPDRIAPLAWTADGVVMGVRHLEAPQWGVQFHPESVLTEYGAELLRNFRRLALDTTREGARTHPPDPAPDPAPDGGGGGRRVESRELDCHPDAPALFHELYGKSEHSFWLDSSRHSLPTSRFSIMGDDSGPLAESLSYSVPERAWTVEHDGRVTTVSAGFFDYLGERLAERRTPPPASGPPIDFNLGYVGALGYELKAETGGSAAHVSPRPDGRLIFADRAVVIDHQERRTHLLALTDPALPHTVRANSEWFARTAEAIRRHPDSGPKRPTEPTPGEPVRTFRFDQPRTAYLGSVKSCLDAINDGESYEICLTNTAESEPLDAPLASYLRLRATSPVPFGAYLRFGADSVLSASPERFLQVRGDGRVQAKPIKGTRPRGTTPEADEEIRRALAAHPKDRAENLMIVDLLRNDLNRVCATGSVHVPTLFDVETYSHVHQLVSTVEGRLAPGRSAVDCVRSAFPGGSMTGAPKIRTMEIIDQLERRARGYYSGAIGWFSLSGAADLSIVIRTVVSGERSATFGVGGAVVSLSDPVEEYQETLVKAEVMLSALNATVDEP